MDREEVDSMLYQTKMLDSLTKEAEEEELQAEELKEEVAEVAEVAKMVQSHGVIQIPSTRMLPRKSTETCLKMDKSGTSRNTESTCLTSATSPINWVWLTSTTRRSMRISRTELLWHPTQDLETLCLELTWRKSWE